MKLFTRPFAGFLPDSAQIGYWPLQGQPNFVENLAPYSAASLGRLARQANFPTPTQSPFDPTASGFSSAFVSTGSVWYTSSGQWAESLNVHTDWSIAFWYEAGSSATQHAIAREVVSAPATAAQRANFRLWWTNNNETWNVETPESASVSNTNTQSMPRSGMFCLTSELTTLPTGAAARRLTWYHNGLPVGVSLRDSPSTIFGTSTSARFQIMNSSVAAAGYTTASASFGWTGTMAEVGVWAEALTPAKVRALYGQCVKTYDDYDLWLSNNQKTRYKVLIESTSSNMWIDLNNLEGVDWVESVRMTSAVGEDAKIALRLRRYRGRYLNLSPLETESVITSLVKLRRRIVVLRAITPALVEPRESDFRYRASGFIDTWDTSQDFVDLDISDDGAALRDNFVIDPRTYVFNPTSKSAEEHQQQIIDDLAPKIRTATTTNTIGYKGGRPIVYAPSGTAMSPTFNRAGQTLRFNDVGTGNVQNAIQAVSDQIGAECRYMPRDDRQRAVLLSYAPRRERNLKYRKLTPASGNAFVDVITDEPHDLTIGSGVSLGGTASHNFIGTVASVNNWFSFRAQVASGYSPTSAAVLSNGTLAFDFGLSLRASDIYGVETIKANAADIRNHAVVRYQRNESTTTGFGSVIRTSTKAVITLDEPLPNIDPEGLGISFEIALATSTWSAFNGKYTGFISGNRTVTSNETVPSLSDGASGTSIAFMTQNQAYRESVSTATSSVLEYGFMPAAVFEGSNLGINTKAEADRLAAALTSDLAEPPNDFRIRMRPNPLELHDVVRLPADPKGRWTGPYDGAVVSIDESCSGGRCEAVIGIRYQKPTLGTAWASRIVSTWDKPVLSGHYKPPIADLTVRNRLTAGQRGIFISRNGPGRREMGLRHDKTVVFASTASGFIPSEANRVGEFRGEHLSLMHDGDGLRLSPGTQYYIRFADRDIFGNLSEVQGLNSATAASQFVVTPRYLDASAAVLSIATGATTALGAAYRLASDGYANGADAASLSFDVFNNRSAQSPYFQCPVGGDYLIAHRSPYIPDTSKVTTSVQAWPVDACILRITGSASLSYSVASFYFAGNSTGSLRFVDFSAILSCASGDRLGVLVRDANAQSFAVFPASTTNAFSRTKFVLLTQDPT